MAASSRAPELTWFAQLPGGALYLLPSTPRTIGLWNPLQRARVCGGVWRPHTVQRVEGAVGWLEITCEGVQTTCCEPKVPQSCHRYRFDTQGQS